MQGPNHTLARPAVQFKSLPAPISSAVPGPRKLESVWWAPDCRNTQGQEWWYKPLNTTQGRWSKTARSPGQRNAWPQTPSDPGNADFPNVGWLAFPPAPPVPGTEAGINLISLHTCLMYTIVSALLSMFCE